METIYVRLLDVIADTQYLEVLCDDIGNAFIQVPRRKSTLQLAQNLEIEPVP